LTCVVSGSVILPLPPVGGSRLPWKSLSARIWTLTGSSPLPPPPPLAPLLALLLAPVVLLALLLALLLAPPVPLVLLLAPPAPLALLAPVAPLALLAPVAPPAPLALLAPEFAEDPVGVAPVVSSGEQPLAMSAGAKSARERTAGPNAREPPQRAAHIAIARIFVVPRRSVGPPG
jgi:hypothetical protein